MERNDVETQLRSCSMRHKKLFSPDTIPGFVFLFFFFSFIANLSGVCHGLGRLIYMA
ncbi:hypothetical protein BDW66DRAFT_133400 [Aspergillus desertorum]